MAEQTHLEVSEEQRKNRQLRQERTTVTASLLIAEKALVLGRLFRLSCSGLRQPDCAGRCQRVVPSVQSMNYEV